ncbi:helix-turn-helix domain-containing protein [Streptomyces sp. NPDC052236]|uniref:helix-turn-helix domain-containing protein n=1 Tax=Streptomyces sp. NPDC052236 TaxID=3365686 RepID=UPI0037CD1DC6
MLPPFLSGLQLCRLFYFEAVRPLLDEACPGVPHAAARGRTGGQKPKLTPRQAKIARKMYEETGPDGRRVHTVEQIAAEFGVTRPTIYRHLAGLPAAAPTP